MVLPFRRRSSEEEPAPKDEDEDLEAILEAVSDVPDEDEQAFPSPAPEHADLDLAASALTVVTTAWTSVETRTS